MTPYRTVDREERAEAPRDLAAGTHETLATWAVEGARFSAGLALHDGVLWIMHGNGVVARFDPRTGSERGVLAAAPSSRGVTLGTSPQINAPAMPTIAPGGDLVFIDEGAVLRWRIGPISLHLGGSRSA